MTLKFKYLLMLILILPSLTTLAKSPEELRIYINPGHGGWTGDDRPCQLVNHPGAFSRTATDTCSFFESNTDLEKGFGLLERLIEYGLPFDRTKNQTGVDHTTGAARDLEQNIVMSRVKNGPFLADNATAGEYGSGNVPASYYWYNRNLTEICEEVQVNNFDMFISIHSNATSDRLVNYPLILYRGYDDCRQKDGNDTQMQQISRRMAELCWDYGYENPHSCWTHFKTSRYIKGDVDFYGDGVMSVRSDGSRCYGYLGALRHSVPGFLVEGFFHSYEPARHRAMNWDVCRVEGIAYAHGIADYFGIEKESYGTIYGIVRDAEEQFSHTHYHPIAGSDDVLKPLNGVTVLIKKDGKPVASYITDDNYNGAFVFDGLEPGQYTVEATMSGYAAARSGLITVNAAEIAYPKLFMEKEPPYRKAGFVYDMKSESFGTGSCYFSYCLSADVEKAELVVAENYDDLLTNSHETGKFLSFEVDNTEGLHELVADISGISAKGWGLRVTPFMNTEAGEIYADRSGQYSSRGGVVTFTDPGYPCFGYTMVAHGNNKGIDTYDPLGEKVVDRAWAGHELWGGVEGATSYNPWRGHERSDKAVFASWGDKACGLVAVDPFGYDEPQSLYAGELQSGGHYIYEGVNVGGGLSGFCFIGMGAETALYTFSEDHEGLNGSGATENSIVKYAIGESWLLTDAPQVIGFKNELQNTNVDMAPCGNGFFAVQNRYAGNNTSSIPSLIYIETEGHTMTFNSGIDLTSLSGSLPAIAVTHDERRLAVAETDRINIYDVSWTGNVPRLTLFCQIPMKETQAWMTMRFDAADNLHAYLSPSDTKSSAGGYHIFALKNEGEPRIYPVEMDIVTGIDELPGSDGYTEDAVFYDLSGRKINGSNLTPGIYIRVSGGVSSKVRL